MNIQEIQRNIFPFIKIISIGLMSGAIGLEAWHLSSWMPAEILQTLTPVLWLGRFAIVAHFLEALIAALSAAPKGKQPLSYGLYTFFVGTVGLIELFDQIDQNSTATDSNR